MQEKTNELFCCGGTSVWLYDVATDPTMPVWTWDSTTADGLTNTQRDWFRALDECKPSPDGSRLLISSSASGGVAVIRREGEQSVVEFAAHLPNAHSIERLPDGRILAAGSISSDRLVLYDADTRQEISDIPLKHAHGVVWDRRNGKLWACGADNLILISVNDAGTITEDARFVLPESGAHDLSPVRESYHLDISTGSSVWRFDCATHDLAPHPVFAGRVNIKSLDCNAHGRWAYQQAAKGDGVWWNDRFFVTHPDVEIVIPNVKLYKTRWNTLNPFRISPDSRADKKTDA